MPDLEEEEIIGGAGGFAEDGGDEFGTDINAGGADVGGFDLGDEDDTTPTAISQSTWYEKVYEDEENAETASHLVM